jgi:N-formylglutamate deformylase
MQETAAQQPLLHRAMPVFLYIQLTMTSRPLAGLDRGVRPATSVRRNRVVRSVTVESAWTITRVGDEESPLVVHVPHAGTWLPDPERGQLLLDDEELDIELKQMTDWFTDGLAFDGLRGAEVSAAVFANRASRLLIDPERFVDDSEAMLAVGMGAVYQSTSDQRPLRCPDPDRDDRLLDRWFHPYAAALSDLVSTTLARCGRAVLVDLHSYPSKPLPYELDGEAPRPGVCIGTDAFHTSEHLTSAAVESMSGSEWKVGLNTPFVGTYVPLDFFGQVPEVQSVMVEIRRDLYQHEPGGALHQGYGALVEHLSVLFRELALGTR